VFVCWNVNSRYSSHSFLISLLLSLNFANIYVFQCLQNLNLKNRQLYVARLTLSIEISLVFVYDEALYKSRGQRRDA
jgi:uncharacterized membrane protein